MIKWIGNHVVDFIARFRNDVYLEDVSSGTIASGSNLGLDSNNKIVKATIASGSGDLTAVVAGTGLSGTSLTGPIPTLNVDAVQTQVTAVGELTEGEWKATRIDGEYIAIDSITENHLVNTLLAEIDANTVKVDLTVDGAGTVHANNYTDTTTNTQLPLIDSDVMTGATSSNVASAESVKAYVDTRYSYQYINFSFKAQNIAADTWMSPGQEGPEYYSWSNKHGTGETQAASDAPSAVDIETTISVDYLDQTSGFVIPKTCKIDGFYGNCKTNGTSPNTLRPVIGFFRAPEPSDGNTSDLTATCIAFDSYDTNSGNRKNRFLKLENSGLDTSLAQGDLLFPAVGFDATANDDSGDMWGSFTIVLKTLIP